jgi:hypothetical protein
LIYVISLRKYDLTCLAFLVRSTVFPSTQCNRVKDAVLQVCAIHGHETIDGPITFFAEAIIQKVSPTQHMLPVTLRSAGT